MLVANRSGAVLGAHTILKEDHFPGCQSAHIPAVLPGAPNFRGVPGFNVYGVGLPTVEGIKATLAHVGAAPGTSNKHGQEVLPCAQGVCLVQIKFKLSIPTWKLSKGLASSWACCGGVFMRKLNNFSSFVRHELKP